MAAGGSRNDQAQGGLDNLDLEATFDFDQVKKDFSQHMPDFKNEVFERDVKYPCVEFSSKVLFEIGPEARKKTTNQINWVLKTVVNEEPAANDGKPASDNSDHYILLVSHKSAKFLCVTKEHILTLGIEAAGLLAVEILMRILTASPEVSILTPLAGAIFSRDEIEEIAAILETDKLGALKIINSSAQPGGQFLEWSDGSVAAVCVVSTTRYIEDVNKRHKIVSNICKKYVQQNKPVVPDKVGKLASFATGGVDRSLRPELVVKIFYQFFQRRASSMMAERTKEIETRSNNVPFSAGGNTSSISPESLIKIFDDAVERDISNRIVEMARNETSPDNVPGGSKAGEE